jgi:hypothetical protein
MSRYAAEFAAIAGVNAVDAVLANLKAAATDRLFLRQAFFAIETAPTNAPAFGFKRMNAVGTGTITSAAGSAYDTGDGTSSGVLETAWVTTRPTVTGNAFRRGFVPLAVGNGFLFDFRDSPIVIPLSAGLCLVNRIASGATLGAFGGYIEWDE